MDGPQEYEVESVTRARVHGKKGKKITWRYFVKWKGYDWSESTWEPTDSFQGGSEHILESFWERIDTGGRDISDATAFKKGEELLVSGPPGGKGLKRKTRSAKTQELTSKAVPSSNGVTISAPPLVSRKRRRVENTADDDQGHSTPKRRASMTHPKNGGSNFRSTKRRRGSSPGLRKSASTRLPSVGDSQLDADGETDPDIVEVEDELMPISSEDMEDNAGSRRTIKGNGNTKGSRETPFDDLEHFYSDNPIDIDQNMDDQVALPKPDSRSQLRSLSLASVPPPGDTVLGSQAPASPALGSFDPLFDSPPYPSDEVSENQRDFMPPPHRARGANPLIKLIDTTSLESTSKQSRITVKARLMSIPTSDAPSASGLSRGVARRSGRPGPGRSSSGLIAKNRSSLLTATKGALKTVKGKFAGTAIEHDQPDEIEEALASREGEDKLVVSSWSDEDVVDQDHQAMSNVQLGPPPSENELLKLAGLPTDKETLPDYEDVSAAHPQDDKIQASNATPTLAKEELTSQSLAEVLEWPKTIDNVVGPSVSQAEQKAPLPDTSDLPVVTPSLADEVVKTNIELAKEHLFPSTQMSSNIFSTTHSSFRTTIFGPLYQGFRANHEPLAKNEPSTTFKVILGDGVELPLVLKDNVELKARMNDILIGNSSGSKVAVFYSAEDAFSMVNALRGDGTARVVLDPSAKTGQQEKFTTFLERFGSSHTLVAPAGKEVCVLYSSENASIAEKLGAPIHLRGLSSTLLISRASIENQLAYVAAIMKATAL